MVSTFQSFYGILLGNYKILNENVVINENNISKKNILLKPSKKSLDIFLNNSFLNNNNYHNEIKTKKNYILNVRIENVYLIYKKFDYNKINTYFNIIKTKFPNQEILGILSGRSFSHPILSFKDQELYLNIEKMLPKKIYENDSKKFHIPLFFICFSHYIEDFFLTFTSKIYYYLEEKQIFKDIEYKIINLDEVKYPNKIEPLINKYVDNEILSSINVFEIEVKKLQKHIKKDINQIEKLKLKEIQKFKKLIKNEIENYEILLKRKNRLKSGKSENNK